MISDQPVAIVTGGVQGIGFAICEAFGAAGYLVVIADLNADQAVSQAQRLGCKHLGLAVDVGSEASVKASVEAVVSQYGRIDALVNNAGIGDSPKPTLEQDFAYFEKVLSVHLNGTFLMSREVARVMIHQGAGSIVNISSIAALGGIRGRNAYGAAKAGIASMTRSMAAEWAQQGVRVNAVAPGYVRTELVERLIDEGAINEKSIKGRTPMGRLGLPQEIAGPILFLCSPQASYITGSLLSVDGGWASFGEPSINPVD
jgi:NAD(P)-dependent dehydrogenase (short-subunit alcohol dehydrogenase family)